MSLGRLGRARFCLRGDIEVAASLIAEDTRAAGRW